MEYARVTVCKELLTIGVCSHELNSCEQGRWGMAVSSGGGRGSASIRSDSKGADSWQDLGGGRSMSDISCCNECDDDRSCTGAGQRDAQSAQFFGGVMTAEILRRHMEVRGGRKHPKAKHHRQQDGEASSQAVRRQ